MSDGLADVRSALRLDFPFYAKSVLKVQSDQRMKPFVLRPAQLELWRVLGRSATRAGRCARSS